MEWIKKKKDEAKQAAAKLQNKRAAFKGEGNVLGGGADGQSEVPAAPAAARPSGAGIKMPSFGRSAPPALTTEEQQRRREQQQKALEQRTNAWEKRVGKARKARLQQEEENAARLGVSLPLPPPVSASSETSANLPPPVVLSNEEVKAREIHSAHAQMGFNPYAATFSSSSEATSAMNSIGGAPPPSAPPPAASSTSVATSAAFPAPGQVAEHLGGLTVEESESEGAVYVLLRQEPTRAITAAETLIKLLSNIVKNPEEEKFRRVRLSNAAIQSKLVSVNGAVDILREAGFSDAVLDGEPYLMLVDLDVGRVQSAVDRTEVALIQLQHDSADA